MSQQGNKIHTKVNNNAVEIGNPRRIAVFRALQLGDLLLAIPALRAIRARFPQAEITLIGLPWAATFARRFRCYIDRFVEFSGYPGIDEVEVIPERTRQFLAEQRTYAYDIVIQMHGNGQTSNACVLDMGARTTVGYYPEDTDGTPVKTDLSRPAFARSAENAASVGTDLSRPFPTLFARYNGHGRDKSVPTVGTPYPDDVHEIERNLGLARLVGCEKLDERLEFPLFNEDYVEAARLLYELPRANRPWIGIHAGARPPSRRWPAEYFAQVADTLADRFKAQVILTGGHGEETTVQLVAQYMKTPCLNLAGKTSLGGLAAIISELDLFISNDTGPAHIANAVDTPSITIFGPVDPKRWAALDQQQ
ncbi:MAG TPA: glycosyltransferase family 9 protein, partial [Ktedonobacteraceae bacterium]|nr:glycosyltransferase family 9 protein [Ktedonobacteraceae bacterium]